MRWCRDVSSPGWPCSQLWNCLVTLKKPVSGGSVYQAASNPRSRVMGTRERRISATPPPSGVALTCATRKPRKGAARARISRSSAGSTKRSYAAKRRRRVLTRFNIEAGASSGSAYLFRLHVPTHVAGLGRAEQGAHRRTTSRTRAYRKPKQVAHGLHLRIPETSCKNG